MCDRLHALESAIEAVRGGAGVESQEAEGQREALKKYTIDVTERARMGKLDPVIGQVLLQSALVGLTHTNERRHLWVNQKFCEMTGYSRDELLGASSRLIHPDEDSWRRFGELAYPVLARGDAFDTEWRIRRKDGSLLWAHFFGRMVDPADAGRGTIWTFVDISERKKAEEDIRAALERQSELNTQVTVRLDDLA